MLVINQLEDLRKAFKKAKALDNEFHRVFKRNQDAQDLGMRPLRAPSFLTFTKLGIESLVQSTVKSDLNVRPKDCESRMEQYAQLMIAGDDGEMEYSPYLPNAALCVYVGDGPTMIGLPDGLTRGKTVVRVLSAEDAPETMTLPVLFVDDEQVELIRKYADSNRNRDMMLRIELCLQRAKPLTGFEKTIVGRALKAILNAEDDDHAGRGTVTPEQIEKALPRHKAFFNAFLSTNDFSQEKVKGPAKTLRSASGMAGLAMVYAAHPESGQRMLKAIDQAISGNCTEPAVKRLWAWLGGCKVASTREKQAMFRAVTYIGKMIIGDFKIAVTDTVYAKRNYLKDADIALFLKK